MHRFAATLRLAVRAFAMVGIFTLICGGAYTFVVYGIAQAVFPYQAAGSIIEDAGKVSGSDLIGQPFSGAGHLWGRVPSFTVITSSDNQLAIMGVPSYASPVSQALDPRSHMPYVELIAKRVRSIQAAHPERAGEAVPVDLVTASASGIDPHISVAAAKYQIPRLVRETGKSEREIADIIAGATQHKLLGGIGEEVVNVLAVNRALDGLQG
ncbi:potassium-transporting ATPase subunit C [Collinsella sp. AGMB00827]|uniref:Potassium-transporting ATPase KdpC subunit n=1 Tax=Collinsella ureilytica TaxID=2869515 RepID=A0ABS7ML81_9ACTN|nr:potassium-transporting ATPase subunit C [Collinsella urealyticum]MBY4798131.1 potassium-transporting ATPase subunit C [Collinsella urealyticum]